MRASRKPEIMGEAAHAILLSSSRETTGRFFIDDVVLSENGVTDFDVYRVDPSSPLAPDFFVPDDTPVPPGVSLKALGPG